MPELRRAVASDLPRIAALARWVWLDSYAQQGVSDDFARYVEQAFAPAQLVGPMWVVEEGGYLLAWAQVDEAAPSPRPVPAVELKRLYVAPTRQGEGLGALLLQQVRESYADRAVWLSAWEGNAGALRFYRREGGTLWGETWFELGGQRHRNEVLGWEPTR
ncbi:GNAT family N-acetyltransferase [Pelomonas sp. KK5]|uniref:GNAT family N-acetyltransferase n=1 Tax=Pelomonas sp. KK5 TaxID=1855730 RepID=UPI00097C6C39|nr:GNAT family N-acetyltransferase [Pelomonas sp. KK5]